MKRKYGISYFIIITALVFALVYGFSMNYEYPVDDYASINEVEPEDEFVSLDNDEIITEGFFISMEGEYIVVYLYDGTTMYLETDIRITDLEESLQLEVKQGKYIHNEEELYSFLENYSS